MPVSSNVDVAESFADEAIACTGIEEGSAAVAGVDSVTDVVIDSSSEKEKEDTVLDSGGT